jgi:hypothetical protein
MHITPYSIYFLLLKLGLGPSKILQLVNSNKWLGLTQAPTLDHTYSTFIGREVEYLHYCLQTLELKATLSARRYTC